MVGGLEHEWIMTFLPYIYILGRVTPTDEVIFFRGVGLNHQPVFLGFTGISGGIFSRG
jgi:hypothetical protein